MKTNLLFLSKNRFALFILAGITLATASCSSDTTELQLPQNTQNFIKNETFYQRKDSLGNANKEGDVEPVISVPPVKK